MGLAGDEKERLSRPVLQPRGQVLPGEAPGSGQAVEVGLGEAEPPVGREQVPGGIHRVVPAPHRGMQGGADVAEGLLDQRDLDRLLAHQMLVQGGGPDAEFRAQPSHGERLRSLPLQEEPGRGNDLAGPRRATGLPLPIRHQVVAGGSSSNTGWRWAMAAISSSLESAPIPSKNTPTSAFQRRR